MRRPRPHRSSLIRRIRDQADQAGIPIIANNDREEVLLGIMLHVMVRLSEGFAATPHGVLGGQLPDSRQARSA